MLTIHKLLIQMATVAILILTGCSRRLEVVLFNDSGSRLIVHSENGEIALGESLSGMFLYPGKSQQWTLRLSTQTCDYAYQVPISLEHYPWGIWQRAAIEGAGGTRPHHSSVTAVYK